jgi:type III secretion protein D
VSKRLRVLTGRHAGASQDLCIGSHTVGGSDDSQILISDWSKSHGGITLELADGGADALVWVQRNAAGEPASQRRHVLHDLRPVRFGDVVLCAGPVSSEWPSDAALLRQVFGPASMIKQAASRHRVLLCVLSAFVAGTVLIGGALYSAPVESAPKRLSPRERAEEIAQRVHALGIGGVEVSTEGDQIVVAGLLEDDAQARKLHAMLQRLDEARTLAHRYASAAQVASMIQGSLGDAELSVAHQGQGVFKIDGHVRSLEALRQKAANLADDMRAHVRRIDVAAVEQPNAGTARPSAVLSDDTDSYVQTAEGIKHLGLLAAPFPSAGTHRNPQEQP